MNQPADAFPLADQFSETNYSKQRLGPSSENCCKVSNRNACGSGALVGIRDGKSLVLTNAHVAGSRPGHEVTCLFPFLDGKSFRARNIMAAYSDRVMMDWAILEIDGKVPLPHIKLSKDVPTGEHYTAGYPRCRGPYFQRLVTQRITHGGTVWRWQPISIGGQSGSAVHSFANHLQYGLLTWSWGGDGAGQTCSSIWRQYVHRQVAGFARPEGLVEICDNMAEDLEPGFFAESNITTLPIWAHLDDRGDDDTPPPSTCGPLATEVIKRAGRMIEEAQDLVELARKSGGTVPSDPGNGGSGGDDDGGDQPPTFGL